MPYDPKIVERYLKIQAVYLSASGGEKQSAKVRLDEHLSKYPGIGQEALIYEQARRGSGARPESGTASKKPRRSDAMWANANQAFEAAKSAFEAARAASEAFTQAAISGDAANRVEIDVYNTPKSGGFTIRAKFPNDVINSIAEFSDHQAAVFVKIVSELLRKEVTEAVAAIREEAASDDDDDESDESEDSYFDGS